MIQIKHGIQVIEVYSSPTSLMTHVLLTITTGYDLGHNGTNSVMEFSYNIGAFIQRTFTGKINDLEMQASSGRYLTPRTNFKKIC